MPYLDLSGQRIYYALRRNQTDGMPVVLLHGAGENHLIWPNGLRRLLRTIVYAIDLPGHGKSTGLGCSTIADYAAWVVSFLDALHIPAAIFIGHSMGGAIVQQLALTHPDRTIALVLIATSAKLRVAPQLLELARRDFPAAIELVSEWEWGSTVPEEIKQLGKQQLLTNSPLVMLDDYRACDAFDIREQVKNIAAPTLIIVGEADRMTPLKHATFMAEQILGARLNVTPEAGHMVMLEAADVVTQAVIDFLREIKIA
ncbi:MAG TPA: alpha/beta fold hydrolase [Anaerolineae bacterium]|nr:alpha/beta fold hydrolase [Anaerolineae bacterium]